MRDDAIDRAEAMTEIMMFAGNVKSDEEDIYIKVSDAVQLLRELPSVIPTHTNTLETRWSRKTGHWINAKVGKLFPSNDFKCSECGNILDFNGVNCGRGDANYCPNCGAKMFEPPQESEE